MPAVGVRRKFGDQIGVWDGSAWVAEVAAPQPQGPPKAIVGGPLEQPMGAMLAAKLGMSPEAIQQANEGYAEGAVSSGVTAGMIGASLAAPMVLPATGVVGATGRFLLSPAGTGTVAAAGELRRSGSPSQALMAGATAATLDKATGASGKLLKWFGKGVKGEASAARAIAAQEAAQAPRTVLSSGAVPTPVPLRIVPPRMSVPVRGAAAEAAAPAAARAESGAVEAVKKIRAARAAKPKAKPPETPLEKAQSAIEEDLKASIELAKARAAGKPMRFEGPPKPGPDISDPKKAAEELQAFILKEHGKGMSKGQITDSLTQIYGRPDIPGPRGKSVGYWKDAVEMVLESLGK